MGPTSAVPVSAWPKTGQADYLSSAIVESPSIIHRFPVSFSMLYVMLAPSGLRDRRCPPT